MTLPAFQKGVYPFFDAADLMAPGVGSVDANIAGCLARTDLVDGVGLVIYGSDPWQNQGDGQAEAVTYLGNLLDQVDRHAAAAGRGPLPIWIRLAPAVPPAWLIAGLTQPTQPTHQRDAQLGIDWVSIHTATLGHNQAHMPYPHTAAYQSYVRTLRTWIAAGLTAHDASATRVPVIHFHGPSAQSKTMGIPSPVQTQGAWLTDGSPDPVWQTGSFASDPVGNAWTYPKHLAAFETFAGEMASVSAFANRYWFFTYTSNVCLSPDQTTVMATLQAAHPNGAAGVIPKQENFGVGVISQTTGLFTNLHRQVYRANIAGTAAAASDWWVAQQMPHGWEAFSPFTLKNNAGLSNTYKGVLTPNLDGTPGTAYDFSEWLQNMFYLTFDADIRGRCSIRAHPWSYEPFGSDLQASTLSGYPSWAASLSEARQIIQGTLRVAKTTTTVSGRFLRLFKGQLG